MKIEIRSRWDASKVLYSADVVDLRAAVAQAVKDRANLTGAKAKRPRRGR